MAKWSDIIDNRRTISCCQLDGIIHVLDFSKVGHNTHCGITVKRDGRDGRLLRLQRPEDITCPLCVQEYSQYLNTQYDTVIKAIKVLRRRVAEIRDALVHFQKEPGITREGFYAVLEKITAPIDGDVAQGRPREGHYTQCKGCGKTIYVRPYREKKDGNYCKECTNKLFRPPTRVKGGGRTKAGLQVGLSEKSRCPKCGTKTLERDGTDLHCWACGHIVYHVFTEN